MGDYWSEHNFDDLGEIEDVMDFVRRMVTGQLPEHWHLGIDFTLFSIFWGNRVMAVEEQSKLT